MLRTPAGLVLISSHHSESLQTIMLLPSGVFVAEFAEWRCSFSPTSGLFMAVACFCDVILFPLADVVTGALQPKFKDVEDSRLRTLLDDLPGVLLRSKADNTIKKYEKGFNAWKNWASHFKEVVLFPASSAYVSLYFLS